MNAGHDENNTQVSLILIIFSASIYLKSHRILTAISELLFAMGLEKLNVVVESTGVSSLYNKIAGVL